ncbi:MAG: lamin tail domain-containing protein, partial [Anaerolineales bacterium]
TTFYFRKEFYLDFDLASVDSLEISVILDDGAVFYLNGMEVLRLGIDGVMGQDNVYYDQCANRSVSRPSCEGPFLVSAESLRQGGNLIAVEVHQSSDDDADDVLFGLELDTTITQIVQQDDQLQNQLALLQGLRITEIMYNPIKGSDYEFIELKNVGTQMLDLTGVRFSRGIRFTFPEIMLNPAEYVVVVSNMSSFRSSYGSEARIAGEYEGKLNNDGESILLQLPELVKAAILRFTYDDSWIPGTDGQGYSLVIQDPHSPASTWSSSSSWVRSVDLNGSPGFSNNDILQAR